MSVPTDTPGAVSEHDSHSDSDWLDIASTDRDSDDNDSIYSSRETDHEDLPRSRSRRSSVSYGSSRDGDVEAWEGLIDDSADEGMPNDVHVPSNHVSSLPQHPAAFDSDAAQDASPEELRVNEGLDQSMISTLSSSRSSSLHASTVHSSSRDLRLSFPDPITSSCRERLGTSYEEIQPNSDPLSLGDVDGPDVREAVDEQMLSASQTLAVPPQETPDPTPSGPELKVFLHGLSTVAKWSITNKLLQKVAHGAGLTISPNLDNLQGSVRRLTISGSFEHDRAFPRIITVVDRTLHPYDTVDDLASVTLLSSVRPLAIVFMPSPPLHLPEHVLRLPVSVSPSYTDELPGLGIVGTSTSLGTWDAFNVPEHRLLRITAPEDPAAVDKDSIDIIDPSRAYQAFSRLWSVESDTSKGMMAGTHALTIIAILSLILGVLVRAALPISLQQFTSPAIGTLNPNSTSGLFWQMLRPAPHRERLPASPTPDSSVVIMPSSFKDFSLTVFSAESTSIMLSHANPTDLRRVVPSSRSEHSELSKDLMLHPPCSVLPLDNRPKALSVIPETSPSTYRPSPIPTGHAVSALMHTTVSTIVKECTSLVVSIMNQDMQDIFDALDALVQAISRQTQMFLAQAVKFIEKSTKHLEKSVESLEMVKESLHVRNERARKRAREMKEMGTKWFNDASEAVSASAQFSKGKAREMAEGLAHRAQRARGRAKEMAAEIQDFLSELDRAETLEMGAWYAHTKQWEEWVRRVRKQGKMAKTCKPSKRKLNSAVFY